MGLDMAMKITASVRGATRKDDQTGVYVAFCPSLQLYSQGKDEEGAARALEGAVTLFLKCCITQGVLDKALKERGFAEASQATSLSPKQMIGEFIAIENYDRTFEFDVPLYLLNQQEKECSAC